ncbi:restriction endonuclease subunit S [Corynebacterium diphtheriae]|uniref:restriction endonuclease subunit S n=1 Tax=Corynebacterium diphtheriae TaxID=1717 RepID=UPI0013C8C485|nr:restriction endonuclease subunit S [Corynebacterium diphtheriae]CAB0572585.1 restriction endonuclease subunit S [Corynebacterium diphtheriae]
MKIRDIGIVFDGPHATPKRVDSGKYYLNISSLENGRLKLENSDHVVDEDFDRWTKRVQPRKDDLLFSYETRLGEAALMPEGIEACLGRRMGLIRPNSNKINSRFLLYYWLSPAFQNQISARTLHGSTVPRISIKELPDWEIEVPEISQQSAIADVLGALDDKIAANIRVKETCTELIKTIGSIPNSNIPVSELAVQVKKQISAGKLQELDVRHYSIPAFDLGYASIESGAEIKSGKNLIEAPCVLVSKLNPRTPRIWSIPTVHSEETTVCSTEFTAWQGTTVPQAALYAALLQGSFSEQLQERASGTSNSHQRVRPQDIQEATIPDVRKLDQETLKLLEALNLQAADLIKENQVLAATRDELLPLLMNGKVTVAEAKEAAGDVGVVKQNKQEEGDGSV